MKCKKTDIDKLVYEGNGTSRDIRWFDELPNFGIRIYPSQRKAFVLSYRDTDRVQHLSTLGTYGKNLTPAQALKDAKITSGEILNGANPVVEKRQARRQDGKTIKDAADAFLALYKQEVRASTYRETARIMRSNVVPAWGSRPVASITEEDVARLINRFKGEGNPYKARQTYRSLTRFFRWSKVTGYRIDLPFDDGTAKQLVSAKLYKKRTRVLDLDELSLVWRAGDALGYPFGRLAQFILTTAQRPGTNSTNPTGECVKAHWPDIDLERAIWSLPENATKNGKAHTVPLSTLAIEVIETFSGLGNIDPAAAPQLLSRTDKEWLFSITAGKHVGSFSKGKRAIDNEIKRLMNGLPENEFAALSKVERDALPTIAGWRWHDLRRTASALMRSKLGIPRDTIDEILNHSLGEISETYQPENAPFEMRRALEAWGRLVRLIADTDLRPRVSAILDGEDYERANEFRRMILSDAESWDRYVATLESGRTLNVVAMPAA